MKQNQNLLPEQSAVFLKNIQFSWNNASTLLLNIKELSVTRGETIFLYGESGSGKTSLLNILAGIHMPQSGTVKLLEKPLHNMTQRDRDKFRAEHIGIIFQQFNLIPYLSVFDNLLLRAEFSGHDKTQSKTLAVELLASLGIENKAHEAARYLSVGQQQRVAVARALMSSPEIILADEPTSALDADNRDAFMELLFASAKKTNSAIVFVSHDKNLSHLFDRSIDIKSLSLKVNASRADASRPVIC